MQPKKIESYWNEEWKELKLEEMPEKLKYEISNYGRIKSYFYDKNGKLLKLGKIRGYNVFGFNDKNKKLTRYLVHKLVAMFFLPPPTDEQTIIIHLDNNKQNNFYKNLQWATEKDRFYHQLKFNEGWFKNRKERNYSKLTEAQVKLIKRKIFDPNRKTRMKIIARRYGISEMQLYRIKSGENWSSVSPD